MNIVQLSHCLIDSYEHCSKTAFEHSNVHLSEFGNFFTSEKIKIFSCYMDVSVFHFLDHILV